MTVTMNSRSSYCEPCTPQRYFRLVEEGLVAPDDRIELLEGLIVSMAPQQPAHAATVWRVNNRLAALIGERAMVRSQLPLLAGSLSVPEPDIAVVPYRSDEWANSHPDHCLLAVEVSDSSLAQDRLTKSRIYAAAGVEDYWIVNLQDRRVEWFSAPDTEPRVYLQCGIAAGEEALPATRLELAVCAADLFPPRGDTTPDERTV